MAGLKMPLVGECWRHYKVVYPSLYEIVATGFDVATGNAIVVYRAYDQDSAPVWVRRLDEFVGYSPERGKRRFDFERPSPTRGKTEAGE